MLNLSQTISGIERKLLRLVDEMKCIYCLEDKETEGYQRTEHVIPKSLGSFKQSPVLHRLVCDDCNQYFGDSLELQLGRDSMEGIARYRFGKSPGKRTPLRRVKLTVSGPEEIEGLEAIPKLPVGGAPTDAVELVPQACFYNPRLKKRVPFKLDEIPSRQELEREGFSFERIDVLGDTDKVIADLKSKGIEGEILPWDGDMAKKPPARIPVQVEERIDRGKLRVISKIAFNYLASFNDRDFLLKSNFDPIRNFIRNDAGDVDDFVGIDTRPFMQEEIKKGKRYFPGHIVFVDWQDKKVIGRVALFNSIIRLSYTIILGRDFPVWFQIQKGSYFHPRTKRVGKILFSQQILFP